MRKYHNHLLPSLIGLALTHVFTALAMFSAAVQSQDGMTLKGYIFITPFMLIGLGLIISLVWLPYKWVKVFSFLGFMYVTFFAIAFSLSLIRGFNNPEVHRFAWLIGPWLFWSFCHYLRFSEASQNGIK